MFEDGKILIFSDIHFGIHGNSEKYLNICVKTMEWISELCMEESVRNVIFMGDFFDSRSSIDVKTLNYASQSLINLSKRVDRVYMILGNHDLYLKDLTLIHSLSAYQGSETITVVQSPLHGDGYSLLPWGYGKPQSDGGKIVPRGTTYVFCHHDFPKSFFFGSPSTQSKRHGDTSTASRYDDIGMDESMIREVIGNDGFIMSGHIHKPRTIPLYENTSLIISGSPYETEYGFDGAECGAYILDGSILSFFPNPHSKRHVELRTSSIDEDMKGVDFQNSFVRLKVDTQESFDTISKIQHMVASKNPYFIFNTVFDFEACPFTGKRDTVENPTAPLPNRVSSKLDYLNAAIDSADFSEFAFESGGERTTVDKSAVKELAKAYYDMVGGK